MVAMPPLNLRSNAGSFEPFQMPTLSWGRNSSRSIMQKKCHIYWRLVIHVTPLSLEWLQCVLVKPSTPSAKAISPRKTSHKSPLLSAPTAPVHTLLAMATALHGMLSAKAVLKKVTGMQSVLAGTASQQPTKSDGAEKSPHH